MKKKAKTLKYNIHIQKNCC